MKKPMIRPGLSLRKNMKEVLTRLLQELFSNLDKVAAHPEDEKRLHKARIAAKPLRYSIEILENSPGNKYEKYFRQIKELMRLMGRIHDLDVSIRLLDDFSGEIPDMRAILAKHKSHRKKAFKEMVDMMAGWKKRGFAKKFLEVL